MAPLYPAWANTVYRTVIVVVLVLAASVVIVPMVYVRTPYNTEQFDLREQPVMFDHRHHARDDGISCLYCHEGADRGPTAGLPSTDVCMGCHVQVWRDSPKLELVRQSAVSGEPIPWVRIHDVADFVYFHHGVHVSAGIDCVRCHGDVSRMASVVQVAPLTMGWCLDCHRAPLEMIPRGLQIDSAWEATVDMFTDSPAGDRSITSLTTCTACHR